MTSKSEALVEFEELHRKKLWHQLSLKVLDYIQDPEVIKSENLLKLYTNLIQPIENKLNPFTYIKIVSHIINQYADSNDAVKFLKSAEPKVKSDKEAVIYCKVLQGEVQLEKLKNQKEAQIIIDEVEKLLEDIEDISSVHNRYYLLASQLYRIKGNHTQYYKTCLKYLGSLDDLSTITGKEQMRHAFLLSLAALLSEDIYNIGELLQHPILDSLRDTPNQWLVDLLFAFNTGNITKFKELTPKWSNIPDIEQQQGQLRRKISILCLMEMAFRRQGKTRLLSFAEISKETELPMDEVELLVMKALSLGLVKGSIDQVSQEVFISWVQPRVIDRSQIKNMIEQLDSWVKNVKIVTDLVEEQTKDFIHN